MSDALVDSLQKIELQVQRIAHLMAGAADEELLRACVDLQGQVSRFYALSPELASQRRGTLAMRLRKTAAALASCQENLARKAVLTQQTLQTLFPATRSDTYGAGPAARARQPYGSAGRQSGEFQTICA